MHNLAAHIRHFEVLPEVILLMSLTYGKSIVTEEKPEEGNSFSNALSKQCRLLGVGYV